MNVWKIVFILVISGVVVGLQQQHQLKRRQQLSPSLMESLVNHPSLPALKLDKRPRRKLTKKHKCLFAGKDGDDNATFLFNELALIACDTGVVPRKELFETFAAALYIHESFPSIRRIADLAGGHGLLSWFLLALDPTRSAIVVDRCMPPSAEIIQQEMTTKFSSSLDWAYVVSDLSNVEPHPSTLLVSVHACASLSDRLVDLAIQGGAPIALAPCCHTIRTNKGYRPPIFSNVTVEGVSALVENDSGSINGNVALADVLDDIRCRTLEQAEYDVQEATLPSLFTQKNRLILAKPTIQHFSNKNNRTPIKKNQQDDFFPFERRSLSNKPTLPRLSIPLMDDSTSIAYCKSISGKAQAEARLLRAIPNHYSPAMDVSIFLPPNKTIEEVRSYVQTLAMQCSPDVALQIEVDLVGDIHVESTSGRSSQTFRVKYQAPEGESIKLARIPKQVAKEIHRRLLASINDDKSNNMEVR